MLALALKPGEKIHIGPVVLTLVWIEDGRIKVTCPIRGVDHAHVLGLSDKLSFWIQDQGKVEIQFVSQKGLFQVRLGFEAPKTIRIMREELLTKE